MDTKFYGKVKNGRLMMENERAYMDHVFSLDGEVEVTIAKRKRGRTIKMNAYYWGVVLKHIADHTGHSTDEIHEMMKNMFLKDMLIVNKEIYRTTRSTTELTTTQFSKGYVDRIKMWAADRLGLIIPDATDL